MSSGVDRSRAARGFRSGLLASLLIHGAALAGLAFGLPYWAQGGARPLQPNADGLSLLFIDLPSPPDSAEERVAPAVLVSASPPEALKPAEVVKPAVQAVAQPRPQTVQPEIAEKSPAPAGTSTPAAAPNPEKPSASPVELASVVPASGSRPAADAPGTTVASGAVSADASSSPATEAASGPGEAPEGSLKPVSGIRVRYPVGSRMRGEEGSTRLRLRVNARGLVEDVGVLSSSGYPSLDDAAVNAARRARFARASAPARVTEIVTTLTIHFKLVD